MSSSIVIEIVAAFMASGIVASIASKIKNFVRNRPRDVTITLASGKKITLDLDPNLSEEKMNELVKAAFKAIEANNKEDLDRNIAESHTASKIARQTNK